MGCEITMVQTANGPRASIKGQPADPASVERYLAGKFGDALPAVRAAMERLAQSRPPRELAVQAFSLYEAFRPGIPPGVRGWGAAGVLDLDRILGSGSRSHPAGAHARLAPCGGSQLPSRISSAAVTAATGKSWQEWVQVLSDAETAPASHKELAAYLGDAHHLSRWWSQQVALAYEEARGRRTVGRSAAAGYEIGARRTLPVTIDEARQSADLGSGGDCLAGRGSPLRAGRGTDLSHRRRRRRRVPRREAAAAAPPDLAAHRLEQAFHHPGSPDSCRARANRGQLSPGGSSR